MKAVRPWQRRRARGGGRHHRAIVIRDMLIDWCSKLWHSVNIKFMCRLPMKVLLVKAQMLQQDYVVSCLKAGSQPERVDINGRWLRHFCHEYRLAVRQPNRKFKLPRWVLAERLVFAVRGQGAEIRHLSVRLRPSLPEHRPVSLPCQRGGVQVPWQNPRWRGRGATDHAAVRANHASLIKKKQKEAQPHAISTTASSRQRGSTFTPFWPW